MKKPHGNTGKRNAAKKDADKVNASLYIRCFNNDKTAWKKKAGSNLSQWVINTLNKAVN